MSSDSLRWRPPKKGSVFHGRNSIGDFGGLKEPVVYGEFCHLCVRSCGTTRVDSVVWKIKR